MRNLFFALVLANLAFAAWHAWFAPSDPVLQRDRGAGRIRLVSEVEAGGAGSTSDAGAPAAASEGGTPAIEAGGGSGAIASDVGASAGSGAPGDANIPSDPNGPSGPQAGTTPGAETASGENAAAVPAAGEGAPPAAPAPSGDPADSAAARCVGIGPFVDSGEADAAAEILRAAGYTPAERAAEGPVPAGYWVHLAGIPTRDEANEMLERLHEGGVPEAYLIPGEEDGDIISLGVFTDTARAGRLREQVRRIGFEPLIADRTETGTVYWIDVDLEPGEDLDLEALQPPGRIVRLELRGCDTPPG
ncbi:MAG TPA: hypothetical protein VF329_13600 [Gammaproteobacteria bacterium]